MDCCGFWEDRESVEGINQHLSSRIKASSREFYGPFQQKPFYTIVHVCECWVDSFNKRAFNNWQKDRPRNSLRVDYHLGLIPSALLYGSSHAKS